MKEYSNFSQMVAQYNSASNLQTLQDGRENWAKRAAIAKMLLKTTESVGFAVEWSI